MPLAARFTDGSRRDPFRNFFFFILFGNIEVAACRKMSGLDATVNVVEFRAGRSLHTNVERSPGRVEYQPVTFEAGKTNSLAFQDWANQLITNEFRPARPISPQFRRDVIIAVRDIDGSEALRYILYKAWVTKYMAISDLVGDGNDTIIETLEITHEGFDRVDPAGLASGAGEGEDEEDTEE